MGLATLRVRHVLTLVILALLSGSCAEVTGPPGPVDPIAGTPTNPLSRLVVVAPGVQLHVLDFGGTGEPILLVTGFGNTANVYRTFAPTLTSDFRVFAVTRRGWGESSQPSTGYGRPSLAHDIKALLDTLGIAKVHLVGHSIAGDELSRFAVDHPTRLGRLVYLDAALDRTEYMQGVTIPAWAFPPPLAASDIISRGAYGDYILRNYGVAFPPAEIVAQTTVNAAGGLTGFVTPTWVADSMLGGREVPPYAAISARALAIYAGLETPADFAPWILPGTAAWDEAMNFLTTVILPQFSLQMARFDTEVANSTVLVLPAANHYLFLCCAATVATAMIDFLKAP